MDPRTNLNSNVWNSKGQANRYALWVFSLISGLGLFALFCFAFLPLLTNTSTRSAILASSTLFKIYSLSHSDSTLHCTPFNLATNFVCLNRIWFTSDSLYSADLSQLYNRRPHTRHRDRIHKAPPVAIHNLHCHHWVIACTTVCMQRTLKA